MLMNSCVLRVKLQHRNSVLIQKNSQLMFAYKPEICDVSQCFKSKHTCSQYLGMLNVSAIPFSNVFIEIGGYILLGFPDRSKITSFSNVFIEIGGYILVRIPRVQVQGVD